MNPVHVVSQDGTGPTNQRQFAVVLWPYEDSVTATVPSLPGCVAQGRDRDDALNLIAEAIHAHILGMEEDGEEIEDDPELPDLVSVTTP